jgi:cytochrome c-type biogenesis protein
LLAFAAGVLSVLSPCVLPLMPAYLSLVSGISVEEMRQGGGDAARRRKVMLACLGFVAGFSAVFILMGVGAVAAGHLLRTWRAELFGVRFGLSQIAGVVIVILGLHMAGISPIKLLYRDTRFHFKVSERVAGQRETMLQGVGLLSIYSLGLAVPFLLAGWSIEWFFKGFQRIKTHFRALEVVSGLILVGVGILLATDQFTALNRRFSFLTDFVNAAERALQ